MIEMDENPCTGDPPPIRLTSSVEAAGRLAAAEFALEVYQDCARRALKEVDAAIERLQQVRHYVAGLTTLPEHLPR